MVAWASCARLRSNAWLATRACRRSAAVRRRSCWRRSPSVSARRWRISLTGARASGPRSRELLRRHQEGTDRQQLALHAAGRAALGERSARSIVLVGLAGNDAEVAVVRHRDGAPVVV